MARFDITCAGEHQNEPVVATVDLDNPTPDQLARASDGYLCEDCGGAYPVLMTLTRSPLSQWAPALRALILAAGVDPTAIRADRPSAALVDAVLTWRARPRRRPR